jgi:CheY-like chemotaxis protein
MQSRPSVLIVDDEINVARTLQMVFENEGYEVETAGSCADALQQIDNGHNYDAIITDLNMETPDVGLKVARAAKGLQSRPVVVICTGYASTSNSGAALDMHVDYLATKPVQLDELISALKRLLARRKDTGTKNGR